MNIYDFKELEKCYVCGNIDRNIDKFIQIIASNLPNYKKVEHPKELERQERIRNRQCLDEIRLEFNANGHPIRRLREDGPRLAFKKAYKTSSYDSTYSNSVIIVSGNCGIGSKSIEYYENIFNEFNDILKANNCVVLFIRGNNDDPSIFNESQINFSNVKTIPDYSVVVLKPFNCLCIGGSVSIDREWKISQQKKFGKKLFWDNEQPYFDEKTLDEILQKFQIGCVITSTSPSFTFPGTNAFNKSKWIESNSSIKSIFFSERKIMDKVYEKIIDSAKPYVWIYGRFKQNNSSKVNDIIFNSLAPFQFEDIKNLITTYFKIDLSKKLGGNVFTFDTFIADKMKQEGRLCEDVERAVEEGFEMEHEEGVEMELDEDAEMGIYRPQIRDLQETQEAPNAYDFYEDYLHNFNQRVSNAIGEDIIARYNANDASCVATNTVTTTANILGGLQNVRNE